ncbi:MAG: AgmX/PglI C-terminal domain-containing protein [Deltaproteobacteria bacterium]|nr:AgmX/PglI C-terminal domain-containing protein [Deltaproteobacteria bacterium]
MTKKPPIMMISSLMWVLGTGCAMPATDAGEPVKQGDDRVIEVGGAPTTDALARLSNNASDGVPSLLQSAFRGAEMGPLTASEVDRTMRSRLGSIRMCQARASRREALPNGKVVVRFRIANDGAVEALTIDGPAFSSTTLLDCIGSSVRNTRFRPSTGQPFAASYPFIFAGS